MKKDLVVFDSRHTWADPLIGSATKRGWSARRVFRGDAVDPGGFAFVRPHAHPDFLKLDQDFIRGVRSIRTVVQDDDQVQVYEDKRAQTRRWGKWMPTTWVVGSMDEAMSVLSEAPYPIISKADVGASSYNVRLLRNRNEAEAHVRQIFEGGGIRVLHCSSGAGEKDATSFQTDYAILQEFVPHHVTYRVNAIGRERAVFFRYCYADRPMAQTGNVKPAYELSPELEDLLSFSESIFSELGTKWCALDILKSSSGWKLLETSLAWPWPSPGDCNNATFFPSGRKWIEMFDLLVEQMEEGLWG